MRTYERNNLQRELDEALLAFRLVRKCKSEVEGGWLLGIRQAIGMPVSEMARRMGVSRWEIHRLERSEQDERILLSSLRRAAKGLGCELVYGLVPAEGTLEELAAVQDQSRKDAAKERHRERPLAKKPFLEYIGWEETWMQALRAQMRREGYRVRPAKTDRNVANQLDDFVRTVKLLSVAGVVGPYMKQFMVELEKLERERLGVVEAGGGEEWKD